MCAIIMRGRARHPSAERLERLAQVLGVPLQELTGSNRNTSVLPALNAAQSAKGHTDALACAMPGTPVNTGIPANTGIAALTGTQQTDMFARSIDAEGNLSLSVPRESPLHGQAAQLLSLFAALPAPRRKALLFWLLRERDLSGTEDHPGLWASAFSSEGLGREPVWDQGQEQNWPEARAAKS